MVKVLSELDEQAQVEQLHQVTQKLPTVNRRVLHQLLDLCSDIVANKVSDLFETFLCLKDKTRMDSMNLSIVLGPNILYPEEHESDPVFLNSNRVVAIMIEKYSKIFPMVLLIEF